MATHGKKRKIFKRQLLLYPTGPNVTKFLLEPPWAEGKNKFVQTLKVT